MTYHRILATALALPVVCVIAAGTSALIVVEVVSGIWRADPERPATRGTKQKTETGQGIELVSDCSGVTYKFQYEPGDLGPDNIADSLADVLEYKRIKYGGMNDSDWN